MQDESGRDHDQTRIHRCFGAENDAGDHRRGREESHPHGAGYHHRHKRHYDARLPDRRPPRR